MNDIYSNDDVKRQLDDIEIKLHRIESMMVGFVMAFLIALITFMRCWS